MHRKIALLALMTLLTACSQPVAILCPARLHMPDTLKTKLKTLEFTEPERDYWKDLAVQQERLER